MSEFKTAPACRRSAAPTFPLSEDGSAIDHALGAANHRPLRENEELITPLIRTKWL
jgi:hypothetical protein